MTETNNNTYKTLTRRPYTPTREEFHKSFAGVLYAADFSTDKPSPWNLDRIARSLRDDCRDNRKENSKWK